MIDFFAGCRDYPVLIMDFKDESRTIREVARLRDALRVYQRHRSEACSDVRAGAATVRLYRVSPSPLSRRFERYDL